MLTIERSKLARSDHLIVVVETGGILTSGTNQEMTETTKKKNRNCPKASVVKLLDSISIGLLRPKLYVNAGVSYRTVAASCVTISVKITYFWKENP